MTARPLDFPPDLEAKIERHAESMGTTFEAVVLMILRHTLDGNGRSRTDTGDPDFEAWWAAYPKKVGKLAALKAWKGARKSMPPLAEMLVTLRAQERTRAWRRDNGQYIPDPERYLKRGRWADDVPDMNLGMTDEERTYRERAKTLGPR